MIAYRTATHADIEAITTLRVAFTTVGRDVLPQGKEKLLADTRRYYEEGNRGNTVVSWLACDGERIAGMGTISFHQFTPILGYGGRLAHIGNMYTEPEYRKRGIASAILDHLIGEAHARGYERLMLNASAMGRGIYEKAGFKTNSTAMVMNLS